MIKSYECCNFKLAIPEVTLTKELCKVKITAIGSIGQEECQMAMLSCKIITLKKQEYEVELHPNRLRINSNGRVSCEGSFSNPGAGFGLAGAKLEVGILDYLKKEQYTIFFSRGSDRKWNLDGLERKEQVEIDRRSLREKRKKTIGLF